MTVSAGVLGALRARVAAIETASARPGRVLPIGDARVDGRLPGGGLQRGRWHELTGAGLEGETAAAMAGFAARLAVGLATVWGGASGSGRGETVWIARRDDLYPPGALSLGLDSDRLLRVAVKRDADALAAAEDALRTPGVVTVAAEVEVLDLTAGRRLQLACEKTGATGLILRRRAALKAGDGARDGAGAAASRWRIATAPSETEQAGFSGLGPPRWRLALERCRGGRTGVWIVECGDGPIPVRVVAQLGDHDLATTPSRRLAAG
jgi:protein ImuA